MVMKYGVKLNLFRVYGHLGDDPIDEYVWAQSAQHAADRQREHYDGIQVEEVSKVLRGWK